jgi:hypothetical protein
LINIVKPELILAPIAAKIRASVIEKSMLEGSSPMDFFLNQITINFIILMAFL